MWYLLPNQIRNKWSMVHAVSYKEWYCLLLLTFFTNISFVLKGENDRPGYEITSVLENSRLVTILSRDGAMCTQFAELYEAKTPIRGAIVRYKDNLLWGVDYARRSAVEVNVSTQVLARQREFDRALGSLPGGREGSATRSGFAQLYALPDRDHVRQFVLSAFGVTDGDQRWRIWIADRLPAPPKEMQETLRSLARVDPRCQKTLAHVRAHPLVRVERLLNGDWKKVLDTISIKEVAVQAGDFAPPAGFDVVISSPKRKDSRTLPPGGFDSSASASIGPGPVMSNPELYVVHWGHQYNSSLRGGSFVPTLASSFSDIASSSYIQYLKQYHVDSLKLIRTFYRDEAISRDVGSANFAAISALVYDVGFSEFAPIFWWEVGGHDPLYTIFVLESEVDSGGWGGYHFLAFSLTHLVLPFPLSLFAHDGIPWLIVKVPDDALKLPLESLWKRPTCLPGSPSISADLRSAISSFDETTRRLSHEIVEAATDPYPFFGWSDPSKQPAPFNSELCDICLNVVHRRGAASTVVGQTSVSTYWSNADHECVPPSWPTLTVFEPQPGQVLPAIGSPIILHGHATDPVDGVISDRIMWQVDGHPVGIGSTVKGGVLTVGPHLIRAAVLDCAGLAASLDIPISVSADAPQVTIFNPADGSSFGAGETIVFRGQAIGAPDGTFPDSALSWTIDGNPFGKGGQNLQTISTIGNHTVELSATSSVGATSAKSILVHVTPPTGKPNVLITAPANYSSFGTSLPGGGFDDHSSPIQFLGTAKDASGQPVNATFIWQSSVSGILGVGPTLQTSLRGGPSVIYFHTITLTAIDDFGKSGTDSIIVSVGQIP
jgi:hypothetical protein